MHVIMWSIPNVKLYKYISFIKITANLFNNVTIQNNYLSE